ADRKRDREHKYRDRHQPRHGDPDGRRRGSPLHGGAGGHRVFRAARGRPSGRVLGLPVRPQHRGRGGRGRHDPGVERGAPLRGPVQPPVPGRRGDRLRLHLPGLGLHLQQPERQRRLRLRQLVHRL
ncbi:MAG: probable iron binding protein from the HesB_IscA_SufA family, partial [uncultured Gemmatimonadetes bacterium]